MKKAVKTIGRLVTGIIIAVVLFGFLFWFAFGGGTLFLPGPARPEITYGEFPFQLVYESGGKEIQVEDTLICEFDGFAANAARGKYRKWKSYLKSGNERITLFKSDDIEIFFTPGINDGSIAAVYMGDTEIYHNDINSTFPDAYHTKDFDDKGENAYIISADEMWDKYKIRLISWNPSHPIENHFK